MFSWFAEHASASASTLRLGAHSGSLSTGHGNAAARPGAAHAASASASTSASASASGLQAEQPHHDERLCDALEEISSTYELLQQLSSQLRPAPLLASDAVVPERPVGPPTYFDTDDIGVRDPTEEIISSVQQLAEEWQQLELRYFPQNSHERDNTIRVPSSSSIIPHHIDIHNIDASNMSTWSHPLVSDEIKSEYYSKLLELFRRVPKYHHLVSDIHNAPLVSMRARATPLPSAAHRRAHWNAVDVAGWSCMPPSAATITSSHSSDHTMIPLVNSTDDLASQPLAKLAFSLYSTHEVGSSDNNNKATEAACQQIIDILDNQTLFDLQSTIQCLHSNTAGNHQHQVLSKAEEYFFIEGTFYMDLGNNEVDEITDFELFPEHIKRVCRWLGKTSNFPTAPPPQAILQPHSSEKAPAIQRRKRGGIQQDPVETEPGRYKKAKKRKPNVVTASAEVSDATPAGEQHPTSGSLVTTATIEGTTIEIGSISNHPDTSSTANIGQETPNGNFSSNSSALLSKLAALRGQLAAVTQHSTQAELLHSVADMASDSAGHALLFAKRRMALGVSITAPHTTVEDILCIRNSRTAILKRLNMKTGFRYLFSHFGACEHYLCLTRIEGCQSVTAVHREDYPKMTYCYQPSQRSCSVCLTLCAQYVVFGDRLADRNPCFYCETCYRMMHYDPHGALLYDDFHVFPYVCDEL